MIFFAKNEIENEYGIKYIHEYFNYIYIYQNLNRNL